MKIERVCQRQGWEEDEVGGRPGRSSHLSAGRSEAYPVVTQHLMSCTQIMFIEQNEALLIVDRNQLWYSTRSAAFTGPDANAAANLARNTLPLFHSKPYRRDHKKYSLYHSHSPIIMEWLTASLSSPAITRRILRNIHHLI